MSISLDHRHHQCAGWHHQYWTSSLKQKNSSLLTVDARSRAQKCLQQPQQQQQQRIGFIFSLWQFAKNILACFFIEENRQKINLKKRQILPQLPEIVLKNFLLSYFEYCQIWLNTLMDDCHLSNIAKLGGLIKEKRKKNLKHYSCVIDGVHSSKAFIGLYIFINLPQATTLNFTQLLLIHIISCPQHFI
jgi:hypothetical protein